MAKFQALRRWLLFTWMAGGPAPLPILRMITINADNCLVEHVVLTRLTYVSSENSDAYGVTW
jgi:hypothetical protein